MTPWEELTQDAVRGLATPESFARGRDYFRQGAVLELVERGNQLHAEVQGSDADPYHVTLTSTRGNISSATCTCPYDRRGYCKHIVAALFAYFEHPDQVEKETPIETVLASLDREQLQSLLIYAVERHPDLATMVEARAAALRHTPVAGAAPAEPRPPQPPLDPAPFRKQVRAAFRSARSDRDYYDEDAGGELAGEILGIVEGARPYVEAGDSGNALILLQAVIEEYIEGIDDLMNSEEDISDLIEESGMLLAEALLTAELTPAQQQEWARRAAGWHKEATNYDGGDAFQAAREAALQGWSYPPLQRVLNGEITEHGAWEGEAPDHADTLAVARLHVLERQGRMQEYLYLAEAEGQTELYVQMLVRLGRTEAAVEYGLKFLTTPGQVLVLARALQERGATEEALRVGDHGLTLPPHPGLPVTELAGWVRDLAAGLGQTERALNAAMVAGRASPTLGNYQAAQALAGERWPELREELLERVRRQDSYYPSNQVDIFLHEGLIDEAIAAVDASPRHELVERVVDAAGPAHADWVFRACCHQFDRIADAGKSTYYREAAQWLGKARAALIAAGRKDEWKAYIEDAIARHQRKYSLRPMLERLR